MEANQYSKEELSKLGIYDLREIGRKVGVQSPTIFKKEQLIEKILEIIYGNVSLKKEGVSRGRPSRSGQKSYQKFIDLIDKIEAPKVNSTFISDSGEEFNRSFAYLSSLSMKVASPSEIYRNDAEEKNELTLKKGVVCKNGDSFVVRKLKFIESVCDAKIDNEMAERFGLQEDDIIDYFLDEYNQVAQIVKVNDKFVSILKTRSDRLKTAQESVDIEITNQVKFQSQSSVLVYAPNEVEREKLIEKTEIAFLELGHNVVKVCFDRIAPQIGACSSNKKSEFFAESVGDEYETIEMVEAGIERAKFYNSLGYNTAILIDNLSWLSSVVDVYPSSVYGNFIAKLAKLSKNFGISVVCFSGFMSNEKVKTMMNLFDNVLNG